MPDSSSLKICYDRVGILHRIDLLDQALQQQVLILLAINQLIPAIFPSMFVFVFLMSQPRSA